MENTKKQFETIDEYIEQCPTHVQTILLELRNVIKEEAPNATEKISWSMPTFYENGNLIHFAAFKNHIGLYPGADGIEAFKHKFTDYKYSKGAVQFPINQPMPLSLIREIVRFRVKENNK